MHKIEIPDRSKTITIPENWDECTPDQLTYILQRSYQVLAGVIDLNTFRILIFARLTGLQVGARYYFIRRTAPDGHNEINAIVYQLAEQLCGWPFSEAPKQEDAQPTQHELNINTVKNLFPTIKAGGITFHGPADLLSNLTFAEFRAALREMDAHIEAARDPESAAEALDHLNRFMAVLYRPEKGKPRRRVPFDPEDHHTYAYLARVIPLWQKNTTLLWFSYCIKYIQSEDIIIDGQIINLSVLFPKSSSGNGTERKGVGWAGLLFDIAKDGPFGKTDKTDQAGLFDVLLYLYKNHLDNKEMERKIKNRKK